jgi:endonuclease/exonuclease/phosphatase family metal-dependent hydrolase
MTYNIRGALGIDNKRSIARIADVIKDSGVDVVCLQEVHQRLPWSKLVDQPRWLGERLRMQFAFQRNLTIGIGGFGNAVLTKHPIVGTAVYALTSHQEQRGLLEVRIRMPETVLTVFCTHLGLDDEERVKQTEEIVRIVSSAPQPFVLCGDFNEQPDGKAMRNLYASGQLTDCADAMHANYPTFRTDQLTSRIDYIFAGGPLKVDWTGVLDTEASDHLPVVSALEVV